jgi:hypothetical protein
MGSYFMDKYSLLHTAVGILLYFWGFSWKFTLLSHILFELVENTDAGMNFINTYVTMWPGGKPAADTLLNSVGDTVFTMLGFFLSYIVDIVDRVLGLYRITNVS